MFKDSTPGLKLILSTLIVVVTALVVMLSGTILAYFIFDLDINDLIRSNEINRSIGLQKYFQMLSSLGIFVFPALIAAKVLEKNPLEFLAINRQPGWLFVLIAILGMYAFLPWVEKMAVWNMGLKLPESMAGIEAWMQRTEKAAMELTLAFMKMDSLNDLWINLFLIALLPALGEELLFRGVIQKYFIRISKNIHLAIWITALIFSLLHFQFYGLLPRLLLGAYMGYLMVYSGSVWVPILAHLINNGTAVVYYYFNQDELNKSLAETEIVSANTWILLLSAGVFSFLFLVLLRKKR